MVEKSTHGYEIELWQPVMKNSSGNGYIAVLSDNSIDRDGEIVGKSALTKLKDEGYTVGLLDHENKILNQVCEWTNKRIEEIDGHYALVAEPKFFLSNPNAQVIKGMLDEGARMGISIGAIVKDSTMEKRGDIEYKVFTDLELLEASFVAIPSNRHGQVMAVAKKFNKVKDMSEEKTYTQKEYDEIKSELEKVKESNDELQKSITEMTEKAEESIEQVEPVAEVESDSEKGCGKDKEKEKEEEDMKNKKSFDELEQKNKELLEEVEKLKKEGLMKAQYSEQQSNEQLEKDALNKGALPVIRR